MLKSPPPPESPPAQPHASNARIAQRRKRVRSARGAIVLAAGAAIAGGAGWVLAILGPATRGGTTGF